MITGVYYRLYGVCHLFFCFNYFSYIAAVSVSIHVVLEFLLLVLRAVLFPNHELLSHITIVEPVVSSEKGINPVAMNVINSQKEIGRTGDRARDLLPVLKSCALLKELHGRSNYRCNTNCLYQFYLH